MGHEFFWPIVTVLKPVGAKRIALAFAAAAVVFAGGVGDTAKTATAPKLSGVYAMAFTSFCQPSLSITQDSTTKAINVQFNGMDMSQHAATADFIPGKTPTAGTVTSAGGRCTAPR